MRPKALQVCLYLLEHRDRGVSKDELIEQVWPDQFISEATLTSTVREVRQATGDSGRTQQIIQVLHGYGYRFVAAVVESPITPDAYHDQDTVHDATIPPAQPPISGPSSQVEQPTSGDLHARESRSCPACQHINRAMARFCESCGQRLDEGTPFADHSIAYTPTPFVGREQELAALKAWLNRAEHGQGQVVGLVGAPGIGRARLLAAFCEDLREKSITTLEVRCQPSGQMMPFFPVRGLTKQYCQIAQTDTIEAMTAKVAHHLQVAALLSEERTDDILHLLGIREASDRLALLGPAMVRVRILMTLRQMFLSQHRQQPLVLVIHDLHWIDVTSAMWLSSLVENLADSSTLILTTYNAGYQPPWIASPAATAISLQPLSPQHSLRVIHARLSKTGFQQPILVSGIWTSLRLRRSVSWPVDRMFSKLFIISRGPVIAALLTAFPRSLMPIVIVRITQAKTFMLHLAVAATSKRQKGRITTNPLLTTRRLD